jgi:hypothetical protein
MSFIDGLLLTLLNTVVCIALPKFLSVITTTDKSVAPNQTAIQSAEASAEISGVMDFVIGEVCCKNEHKFKKNYSFLAKIYHILNNSR